MVKHLSFLSTIPQTKLLTVIFVDWFSHVSCLNGRFPSHGGSTISAKSWMTMTLKIMVTIGDPHLRNLQIPISFGSKRHDGFIRPGEHEAELERQRMLAFRARGRFRAEDEGGREKNMAGKDWWKVLMALICDKYG